MPGDFEVFVQIRIMHGNAWGGGHEAADGAVDVKVCATHPWLDQRVTLPDTILQRVAEVTGEIGRDLRVMRPRRFRVIRPADNAA
jgi:hypothetical protein